MVALPGPNPPSLSAHGQPSGTLGAPALWNWSCGNWVFITVWSPGPGPVLLRAGESRCLGRTQCWGRGCRPTSSADTRAHPRPAPPWALWVYCAAAVLKVSTALRVSLPRVPATPVTALNSCGGRPVPPHRVCCWGLSPARLGRAPLPAPPCRVLFVFPCLDLGEVERPGHPLSPGADGALVAGRVARPLPRVDAACEQDLVTEAAASRILGPPAGASSLGAESAQKFRCAHPLVGKPGPGAVVPLQAGLSWPWRCGGPLVRRLPTGGRPGDSKLGWLLQGWPSAGPGVGAPGSALLWVGQVWGAGLRFPFCDFYFTWEHSFAKIPVRDQPPAVPACSPRVAELDTLSN